MKRPLPIPEPETPYFRGGVLFVRELLQIPLPQRPTVQEFFEYLAPPHRPLKFTVFDGVEAQNTLSPSQIDMREIVVLNARILSCRKVWRIGARTEFVYVGKLEVGDDEFVFETKWPVPLGRRKVVVIPEVRGDEKKKQIVLNVIGFENDAIISSDGWVPHDLNDIRALFPLLVGEDVNVALAILSLASRLNLNRDFWIMGLIVQGESSSGKSYLVSQVIRPFQLLNRVEEFTRYTGPYLERKFRGRNMDEVILVIYELSENTPQQLHLSLSEGRLRVGLVDRETGQAIEYEFEGMPFLISTTPLEALRPDLRNRVIVTSIDESEEQTRRILQFETMMAQDGVYAKKLRDDAESFARRFAGYFRELKPAYVVVPFAEKLYERLSFHTTKLRRDWKKLLALLQASALLFQHERKVEEVDGVRVVYADHRDLRNLIAIMPAFAQTLQNLTEPQRRLLSLLSTEFAVTTRQIAQSALQAGWAISPRRIRQILEELEALGYVVVDRESREHKYLKLRDAP